MARRSNEEANPRELSPEEVAKISPLYRDFAAQFGKSDADQILLSGAHHRTREKEEDWFADCVIIAIAYDCFTTYHDEHGFLARADQIDTWINEKIDFDPYVDGKVIDAYQKKFKKYL